MASIDMESLVAEIVSTFRSQPYLKTEAARAIRRQYSQHLKTASAQDVIELALRLLDEKEFIFRFMAYELISSHKSALSSLGEEELEKLGRGISSWQDVDTFACSLTGPAWREHQVSDALIERWAHSDDRWWRRTALVSTVPLNLQSRGGTGDAIRTLTICRILVADYDDMVVKALSWALRQLVKHDPQAVQDFLTEHESVLAARVLREVRHKLTTGLKNLRRQRTATPPSSLNDQYL